ncbi:4Fe-4S dicluster domain-containing protein, partial [uncultured Dubosiella sp.]
VTVSGAGVKDPMNVSVPVGMPVKEIFEHTGFKLDSVRLIAGGPMMGKAIPNDMFVIDRAMNALTILDNPADNAIACLRCGSCSDHCPAGLQPVRIAMAMKEGNIEEMERRQAMSCIECGLCTYVCPSKIDVTENVRKAKRALALQKKK